MKKQIPTPTSSAAGRKPGVPMYWLFKSEPDVFSWDMLVARGAKGEPWTGVRNYLARNHMRAMQVGDLGFFYHSNIGKEIVGVLRVSKTAYPEPGDATGKWECVEVVAVRALPKSVTLGDVKADTALAEMALVKSMRLSVQPVTAAEWGYVCERGDLDANSVTPPKARKPKAKAAEKSKA